MTWLPGRVCWAREPRGGGRGTGSGPSGSTNGQISSSTCRTSCSYHRSQSSIVWRMMAAVAVWLQPWAAAVAAAAIAAARGRRGRRGVGGLRCREGVDVLVLDGQIAAAAIWQSDGTQQRYVNPGLWPSRSLHAGACT